MSIDEKIHHWKELLKRVKRRKDSIQERSEQANLIYFLHMYAKEFKTDFGEKIEEQAASNLKSEYIDIDALRDQLTTFKKADSITNIDLVIHYLSASEARLSDVHVNCQKEIDELIEYAKISNSAQQMITSSVWKCKDCKYRFMKGFLVDTREGTNWIDGTRYYDCHTDFLIYS